MYNIYQLRQWIEKYSKQLLWYALLYCNRKQEGKATKQVRIMLTRRIATLRECLDALEEAIKESEEVTR